MSGFCFKYDMRRTVTQVVRKHTNFRWEKSVRKLNILSACPRCTSWFVAVSETHTNGIWTETNVKTHFFLISRRTGNIYVEEMLSFDGKKPHTYTKQQNLQQQQEQQHPKT